MCFNAAFTILLYGWPFVTLTPHNNRVWWPHIEQNERICFAKNFAPRKKQQLTFDWAIEILFWLDFDSKFKWQTRQAANVYKKRHIWSLAYSNTRFHLSKDVCSCFMPAIILKLISLVRFVVCCLLLLLLLRCHFVRIYDMKWRQSFVYSNINLS